MTDVPQNRYKILPLAAVAFGLVILYAGVLQKLASDWWTDDNYSHGLLVPFVIAFIIWAEWGEIGQEEPRPSVIIGTVAVGVSLLLLTAGVTGAELFTQRISLVLCISGVILYLFGRRILSLMLVPLALILCAIPVPQIVFNKIAFPLQIRASQLAVWGIKLAAIPTTRSGNIIDILPRNSTQTISLEVVEACSGIRSLMTLVTLALVFGYFTRKRVTYSDSCVAGMTAGDVVRTMILMIAAVPIAVVTNGTRVALTGGLTYFYGRSASEGTVHEISGWLVYVAALAILYLVNIVLTRLLGVIGGERNNA